MTIVEDGAVTPRLTDPLTLACGLTLGNRLAKAAMTECVADPRDHQPSVRHERLYRRWAEGGRGLCITGNVMVDRRYLERTTNVVVDERTDRAAPLTATASGPRRSRAGRRPRNPPARRRSSR